jgi:predicted RNase H-like HicB family nuclease
MRFTVAVTREGDWYVAQCLEIDVASQGSSVDGALESLREALELRLEDEPASALPTEPAVIARIEVRSNPTAA